MKCRIAEKYVLLYIFLYALRRKNDGGLQCVCPLSAHNSSLSPQDVSLPEVHLSFQPF